MNQPNKSPHATKDTSTNQAQDSWNRQRSRTERNDFIRRKLAALATISIEN